MNSFFKVVDSKTERNLGPNEEGELRVKGLSIRHETHDTIPSRFDKHGWFKTEQIVGYDDNCLFYINEKEQTNVQPPSKRGKFFTLTSG